MGRDSGIAEATWRSKPMAGFVVRASATPSRFAALVQRNEPNGVFELQVWEADSGRIIGRRRVSKSPCVIDMASGEDGHYLAYDAWTDNVAGERTEIGLWNLATGEESLLRLGRPFNVTELRFSPDAKTLAVVGHDCPCAMGKSDFFVDVWDVKERRLRDSLREHGHFIYALAFSPDGKRIAAVSADLSVTVWDAQREKRRPSVLRVGGVVRALAFAPDGKRLAVAAETDPRGPTKTEVELWNVETNQRPQRLPLPCGVASLAYAPTGRGRRLHRWPSSALGTGPSAAFCRFARPQRRRSLGSFIFAR